MLNQIKNFVNEITLKNIYFTLLQPQILYGLTVWGGTYGKGLTRLSKLQKKAIRTVTYSKKMDHSEPRMKRLGILKLEDLFKLQTVSLAFDCLKNESPEYFKNLFTYPNNTGRTLRTQTAHPHNITLSVPRRIPGPTQKTSFFNLAPNHWNDLPDEVKKIQTKNAFRANVKKFYLSAYKSQIECTNIYCSDIYNCFHVRR